MRLKKSFKLKDPFRVPEWQGSTEPSRCGGAKIPILSAGGVALRAGTSLPPAARLRAWTATATGPQPSLQGHLTRLLTLPPFRKRPLLYSFMKAVFFFFPFSLLFSPLEPSRFSPLSKLRAELIAVLYGMERVNRRC